MKQLALLFMFAALPIRALAGDLVSDSVNGSNYYVGSFEGGVRGSPNATPWTFEADGTVYSGQNWKGTWKKQGDDTVSMQITLSNGLEDWFVVQFSNDGSLVAWKDGQTYRWGQRGPAPVAEAPQPPPASPKIDDKAQREADLAKWAADVSEKRDAEQAAKAKAEQDEMDAFAADEKDVLTIQGIALGIPSVVFARSLAARSDKSLQTLTWQNIRRNEQTLPDGMKYSQTLAIQFDRSIDPTLPGKGVSTETYSGWFTAPVTGNKLRVLWRDVRYLPHMGPSLDETVAALHQKYGTPAFEDAKPHGQFAQMYWYRGNLEKQVADRCNNFNAGFQAECGNFISAELHADDTSILTEMAVFIRQNRLALKELAQDNAENQRLANEKSKRDAEAHEQQMKSAIGKAPAPDL